MPRTAANNSSSKKKASSRSKNANKPETKTRQAATQPPKVETPRKQTLPAWAGKYQVSLELNGWYEIPQLGGEIISPSKLTLEKADLCFERGCTWITLR